MDPQLFSQYLELAHPYIQQYGYAAVFVGILLEDFGVPVPGETLLIAGALLADQGQLHIGVLVAVAWLAAVTGDNIGYALGRFGGRRLVLRFGRYVGIRPHYLTRVEAFFARYGGGIVVVARFFELLRQLNGIVAGLGRMSWWRFLAYNAVGAALWVGVWGAGVFRLGLQMEQGLTVFKRFEPVLVGLALVGLILVGVVVLWRRHGRPQP